MSTFLDIPAHFTEATVRNSRLYELVETINIPFLTRAFEQRLDRQLLQLLFRVPQFRQAFSFLERGGLFAGDAFLAWMRERLDADGRNLGSATFAEFYEHTRAELTVVAADTTGHRLLVLNRHTVPACPVAWAVRMSMSIPFLWQEVIWDAAWGRYNGVAISGHSVVDGGLLSNFPLELFLSHDPYVLMLMGEAPADRVLGCLIDETLPVEPAAKEEVIDRIRIGPSTTLHRILNLINTMTQAHDNLVATHFDSLVARLPAKGYGTTEFDMNTERLEALVNAGHSAMQRYLAANRTPVPQTPGRTIENAAGENGSTAVRPIVLDRPEIDRVARQLLGR